MLIVHCVITSQRSELLGLPADVVVIDSLMEERDCFSWRLMMESRKGGMKKQLKNSISGTNLSALRNPVGISNYLH